ncbi:MAG: HD domain-containing protein [Anaerosomatales bacterium]|nr:HD domain-containing protein [Anaerosomatales bacterium]MDT8434518.1 HD domain-containing protein [Anaerosomatales bacterium]
MRRYLEERQELIAAAAPGTDSARRLAHLTDQMLAALAEESADALLPRQARWSLIALGGYGAGTLLPASDLDLLVLSDARAGTLARFVEALLYPLWDAGLAVGHQVRSRRQQMKAVREDLPTLTATLTGRVIAGDRALGLESLRACAADGARRSAALLTQLGTRERPGSPYLLEPELKAGAGGKRDFDELTWSAALLTGVPQSDPSPLLTRGLLDKSEHARLASAADVIASARWEIQQTQSGEVMTEELAAEMRVDPSLVQRALADTHHLLLRVRPRIRGQMTPAGSPPSPCDVFDLVARGSESLPALEEAAWAGQLDHLVPGMSSLMWLRRPGIAHALTVGAHSLRCAVGTADIIASAAAGTADDPVLSGSALRIGDARLLTVAALTHDVGKATPGAGHPARGAPTARVAAERFGLDAGQAQTVSALVGHHLLLASAASGVDLDEPADIDAVARTLGDASLLAPLHVLTVADSRATGPGAWSAWHADLLATLVSRLYAALSADEARALRAGSPTAREHLADLAARVAADRTPGTHALEIGAGPIPASYRVNVAAPDRPGLLAIFAGTFALAGLDILAANSVPTRDGIALDSFVVTSATLAPVSAETWSRFERMLSASLAGRLALSVRLSERRRLYAPRVIGDIQARIEEDARGALLHVRAPDHVGLLYDIARAISESGLDVRSLTATSRAGWTEDTLRLGCPTGMTAGALGQLSMRLRAL